MIAFGGFAQILTILHRQKPTDNWQILVKQSQKVNNLAFMSLKSSSRRLLSKSDSPSLLKLFEIALSAELALKVFEMHGVHRSDKGLITRQAGSIRIDLSKLTFLQFEHNFSLSEVCWSSTELWAQNPRQAHHSIRAKGLIWENAESQSFLVMPLASLPVHLEAAHPTKTFEIIQSAIQSFGYRDFFCISLSAFTQPLLLK